jgi:transcription elongation GreA/GreB family factor
MTVSSDRHDPDLGFVSTRHASGIALLGKSEDEEVECEMEGCMARGMIVKIEKADRRVAA